MLNVFSASLRFFVNEPTVSELLASYGRLLTLALDHLRETKERDAVGDGYLIDYYIRKELSKDVR